MPMQHLHLNAVEWKEPVAGFKGRFVHSANMTFAYWNIAQDSRLPEHAHPHEQVASVIEGQFEMTVDGETKVLGPGSVVIIPPNVNHSGRAITSSRIIDVFYPTREDYR